jgi:DNA-binding transcriptional ArsR family regulator
MVTTYNPTELNKAFEALANEHRREIVYVLSLQPASIGRLAEMRGLSLPAIHKHIKQDWLSQYHAYWGTNEETLENYEQYLKR